MLRLAKITFPKSCNVIAVKLSIIQCGLNDFKLGVVCVLAAICGFIGHLRFSGHLRK